MASIIGFGGIFLRADDPKALYQWYERHLGLVKSDGSFAYAASKHNQRISAITFPDKFTFQTDRSCLPSAVRNTNSPRWFIPTTRNVVFPKSIPSVNSARARSAATS
jgi:hypothetical protein